MSNDNIQQIILEEVRNTRDELKAHRAESLLRHDGIDTRVRHIESWQSNANGKITMIGIVGVLVGGVIGWITDIFKS